ncbi:MAG: hypothetical protein RL637_439, partial [Pseudomonadota bacterium]
MTSSTIFTLGIDGFNYADLYQPAKLKTLFEVFERQVAEQDSQLFQQFNHYRHTQGRELSAETISQLLVQMSVHVGQFVAQLFQVKPQQEQQRLRIQQQFDTVFAYKNTIVAKLASTFKNVDSTQWDLDLLDRQLSLFIQAAYPELTATDDQEFCVANVAMQIYQLFQHYQQVAKGEVSEYSTAEVEVEYLRQCLLSNTAAATVFGSVLICENSAEFVAELFLLIQRWSFLALKDQRYSAWLSFKSPQKRDFSQLVKHETVDRGEFSAWMGHHRRHRDGFALTDKRFNERQVLYEVDHCIYCHDRNSDSCSKGMISKKTKTFNVNALGVTVTGCPLEEKISEMHLLKRQGDNIAALALITIDNPLCAGTGHRICNDCMRGCIYQKTEPVNIPQIETNVLTDVLFMPYGFEIYSLLTRWNPLNIKRPYPLPYNGKKVLVVGLGPAGYTMSHYLLNEGFAVVGIDGLKLEPLPVELVGNEQTAPQPLRDFSDIYEALDKRILAGFGGVAEYGITVRWDKNFLKVIYVNLLRRQAFRSYGGIRFGGTLTIEDAWKLGFDHISIAAGAGKPTIIELENNLMRGIRKASDFLMGLQLTGAAKTSSLANLQVRLPAGVIGGGLTAIDTATELMAYYPVQVEKILHRYEILTAQFGEDKVHSRYDAEELIILQEFLAHGHSIRAERQRAEANGEIPNFQPLIESWGGVTLFYRKGMNDSPAYRQNHEEIHEALQEGIALVEGMSPKRAIGDEFGHLAAV